MHYEYLVFDQILYMLYLSYVLNIKRTDFCSLETDPVITADSIKHRSDEVY